ncbi:hypothetical protein BJV74DRAFT_572518 [Russula compacta]|nr:hypothetical protein BJV74DRAFT_572518 [Russula compacta]
MRLARGAAYRNLNLITRSAIVSLLIKPSSPNMPNPCPLLCARPFPWTPILAASLLLRQSRPRLNPSSQSKPPSPLGRPVISGSPIIPQRNVHAPRAQPPPPLDMSLWLDGDDFGARRARSNSPPSTCPPSERPAQHDPKRQLTPISTLHPRSRTRPRSPPPSPDRPSTPPPVPPIPTHFLGLTPVEPVLQPRSTNHLVPLGRMDLPSSQPHASLLRKSRSTNAITCINFLAVQDGQ